MTCLAETFDGIPAVSLLEGSELNSRNSIIDGKYIIGMIEGQFFKPDGMSRNGRWYPRSLWEKSLRKADTKNRLANRTMFGEIGHSEGPVEDMTLRAGTVSHFIADLWIDEKGRGMGRAYILGTEAGKLLKIYLGAGCKLKVSTRGEGSYKPGETHDGCPVVDDDTYDFQTVDFVLNPGFLETSAILKESYNGFIKQDAHKKELELKEIISHIQENKNEVTETANTKEGEQRMTLDLETYVADLKAELKASKAEVTTLREALQEKEKELLQSKFSVDTEIKKLNEELKPYKQLKASPKALNETLKKAQVSLKKSETDRLKLKEELKKYTDRCGSLEDLDAAIKLSAKSLRMIEEYRKLGTPKDFKDALAAVEANKQEVTRLTESLEAPNKDAERALAKALNHIKVLKERYEKSKEFHQRAINEAKDSVNRKLAEKANKVADIALRLKEELEANECKLADSETAMAKAVDTIKDLTASLEAVVAEKEELERVAEKVGEKLECYKNKFGKLNTVNEAATLPKNVKNEALSLSKKYQCTVESAAKLVNKHGLTKAQALIEKALANKKASGKLIESKKLVEEVAQLDKVKDIPEEKTAKDYLTKGMINNYFNHDAFGKEVTYKDFENLDGTKVEGVNAAKALLKKYSGNFEVEPGPSDLNKENTPAQAEAEAKKLLK